MDANQAAKEDFVIRVVLFNQGRWLVAQCLDVDIAAQGKTEREVLYQLSRLLVGRILASEKFGVEPFDLPAAPQKYWDMYSQATSQPARVLPFVPIDAATTRSLPTLEMKAA
jgi:hypothetical protein